ncbi:MAG: hypothetical protein EHM33_14625 [Chloroflexi bacterium]|nr:MAG: hypothetical protein EHM33_14625 [Chloroflexota bacterium]
MQTRVLLVLLLIGLFPACTSNSTTQIPSTPSAKTSTPDITLPPTGGYDPSYKVAAFYYPWYGNPDSDGEWIHWAQDTHLPPEDIRSDYYPALGAYSSNDPAVVAQHMEWLSQAGIGVIISSWWGQGSREDRAVPLLLQTAERYGIKVAFHIEPYHGRTGDSLVNDIQYLYKQYGSSPAFFRSTATSGYSPDGQPKGMFFVWSIEGQGETKYSHWQPALDQIHALPEGGLVIANSVEAGWIEGSHFDGLYNYATLHLEENSGFDWARSLPPNTLYVPSVLPGFSAKRIAYPDNTYVPRQDGNTYNEQWTAALGTGIQPEMVTITSFNEWHEGSIIEPIQFGVSDGNGYPYADFGTLLPEGYLSLTRDWIDKYLSMSWPIPYRARIRITTTSDWTTLDILKGGAWIRPERISVSDSATLAGMEYGDRFVLMQSLADANAGRNVEVTWDVLLTDLVPGQDLILQIDRGSIGKTQVTIYNYTGSAPVELGTFESDKLITDRDIHQITIPFDKLTGSSP